MNIHGKVWKFGDHVNTDDIIAARYLNTTDEQELASHCMETISPSFATSVRRGDIVAAGENFGCGSSREHAPVALKAAGVSAVIAKSFARIFLRNAINIGLPLIECPSAGEIVESDELDISLDDGIIKNITRNTEYRFPSYPEFLTRIIATGGLMQWVQKKHIASVSYPETASDRKSSRKG